MILPVLMLLQSPADNIVITGKRLVEAQAVCARGGCTVRRDVQASIALAEAEFRTGNYKQAKHTLEGAISRNRKHAATDPKLVAALYEAYATVSQHEGNQRNYRTAVANRVDTLRDNLPPDDPTVIAATPALGDMWMELRNYRQATASYKSAERAALEAGNDKAAVIAGMKRSWAVAAGGDRRRALQMIDDMEQLPVDENPQYRLALRVLRLRIAARDADERQMAELVKAIGRQQGEPPALIWAPPFEEDAINAANANARKFEMVSAFTPSSSEIAGIQWADVGFWIKADGRTKDPEMLRGSKIHPWLPLVLAQVRARRYAATANSADDDGIYRIERVTKRTIYATPPGSVIRRRVWAPGFEVLDITDAPAAPPE